MTTTRTRAITTALLLAFSCAITGCALPVAGSARLPGGIGAAPITTPSGGPPVADRVAPVPPAPPASSVASGPSGDDAAVGPGASDFVARMRRAMADVTSLRGTLQLSIGSAWETATFAETFSRGTVSAVDIRMTVRGPDLERSLRLLVVGARSYLGPASTLRALGWDTGGKPWLRLTDTGPDSTLRQLAEVVEQSADQVGPVHLMRLAAASSGPMTIGREDVAGGAATHYRLAVSVSRLAELGAIPGTDAAAIGQAGVSQIPLDVWLDALDRPVQVRSEFSVQAVPFTMVVTMGRFDEPLTISRPDPASVASG